MARAQHKGFDMHAHQAVETNQPQKSILQKDTENMFLAELPLAHLGRKASECTCPTQIKPAPGRGEMFNVEP